jgi:hypothetical protein
LIVRVRVGIARELVGGGSRYPTVQMTDHTGNLQGNIILNSRSLTNR